MDTETHNNKLHAHERAADAAFDREALDERLTDAAALAVRQAIRDVLGEGMPMPAVVSLEDAIEDWWRECGDDVIRHAQQCARGVGPW